MIKILKHLFYRALVLLGVVAILLFVPLGFNWTNTTNGGSSSAPCGSGPCSPILPSVSQLHLCSTFSSSSESSSPIPIGAFLYMWYGYNYSLSTWTGGLGTSHWNDSSRGVVEDKPVQGYYSMMNNKTLALQIEQMEQAGIDFAVVSWWGWGVYNFANPKALANQSDEAINNATLNLFKLVSSNFSSSFKLAIMVDAFNTSRISQSNYSSIENYVNDEFYSRFPEIVMKNQSANEPFLFWFNPLDPPASVTSTENIVVGNDNPYDNLTFWKAPAYYLEAESNQTVANYEGNPTISKEGIVSIIPRYDDWGLYKAGGRTSFMRFDISYSEDMYQYEWSFVLNHTSSVKMVLIYSWNEYHERSEIEPHYDNSSPAQNPSYLLDLTTMYTGKLDYGSRVPCSTRSIVITRS